MKSKALEIVGRDEVARIARQINEREQTLRSLEKKTRDNADAWMCEAIEQGADLIKAKEEVGHGYWQEWLRIHCPLVSARSARVYMEAANTKRQRAAFFDDVQSLRQMLAKRRMENASEQTSAAVSKSWPDGMEAIGLFARLIKRLKRAPMSGWPKEFRTKFMELKVQFEELVAQ